MDEQNQFRVIPTTPRPGFENNLPFISFMVLAVEATAAYTDWVINGIPTLGVTAKYTEADVQHWRKQLHEIFGDSTTLNGVKLWPDDIDAHIAECWALKSRIPYSTFYNAVTNGRYSEEVFGRAGEREDFILAVVNHQFTAPVIAAVAARLEKR